MQQKFCIAATEHFNLDRFPTLEGNLVEIETGLAHTPNMHKTDMLVCFLKRRSTPTAFVAANPAAARLISSGTLPTTLLEELFESSKGVKDFTRELEGHIQQKLKPSTVTY